jgi:hypothetical protein
VQELQIGGTARERELANFPKQAFSGTSREPNYARNMGSADYTDQCTFCTKQHLLHDNNCNAAMQIGKAAGAFFVGRTSFAAVAGVLYSFCSR